MSSSENDIFSGEEFNYDALEEFDHVGGDRLQILNQIGKSQALVFHALDLHTAGGEVAVKVIECHSKSVETFRIVASRIYGEVRAWAALEVKSPYILPLKSLMCHRVVTRSIRCRTI